MLLGSMISAYNQAKSHSLQINEIKKRHNFYAEIKWSKVSQSKLPFYSELIDYFFVADLKFRAIGVEKSKINNSAFSQTYDDFYYKMYYQLLNHKIDSRYSYNVYLEGVFDRDITNNRNFNFRHKQINPTPAEGMDSMERLFIHLTTVISEKSTRKRVFDMARAVRLHWIRHHIEEKKCDNMCIFSVEEPSGIRAYIYDIDERYVIVLEPMRNLKKNEYALLTAYYEHGKDKERNKVMKKYKRRLPEVV